MSESNPLPLMMWGGRRQRASVAVGCVLGLLALRCGSDDDDAFPIAGAPSGGSTAGASAGHSGGGAAPVSGGAPAGSSGGETPQGGVGGETPQGGVGGETPQGGVGGETPQGGVGGETPQGGVGGETPQGGVGGEGGATSDDLVGCSTVPFGFVADDPEVVGGQLVYAIDGDRSVAVHVVLSKPATLTFQVRVPNDTSAVCCNSGTCTAPNYARLTASPGGDIATNDLVTEAYWKSSFLKLKAGDQYIILRGEGSGGLCNDWPEAIEVGSSLPDPFLVNQFCFSYD